MNRCEVKPLSKHYKLCSGWQFWGQEAIYMSVYSQQQTTHLSFLSWIGEWRLYILDQIAEGAFFPLVLYSLGMRAVTERYFLHFGRQRWECHKTNSCDAMCIHWQWLIIARKNYSFPAEDRVDDLCCRTALCSKVLPVSQCPVTLQWNSSLSSLLRLLCNSSTKEISEPGSPFQG